MAYEQEVREIKRNLSVITAFLNSVEDEYDTGDAEAAVDVIEREVEYIDDQKEIDIDVDFLSNAAREIESLADDIYRGLK